jgi:hypothetical protein
MASSALLPPPTTTTRLPRKYAPSAGATWPEIHKVIELAALVGGFTALIIGGMIIAQLRESEAPSKEVDQ